MSYRIIRKNEARGTMEVLYDDGEKLNIRVPEAQVGTPEYDEAVYSPKNRPALGGLYVPSDPGSNNPFKKTIPVHDRRR